MHMEQRINRKSSTILILTISVSIILLSIALTQDAYYTGKKEDSIGSGGIFAFLLGWMNITAAGISWLANPALIISYIKHAKGKLKHALYFAIAALVFSLSFLLFNEIIVNESGSKSLITGYGPGYWFWLASIIADLAGIVIALVREKLDQY